jgi:hypothetical protein
MDAGDRRRIAPSYVFEGMRAVVADKLALGGGLVLVYLVLACLLFMAVYRIAIRSDLSPATAPRR